MNAGQEEVRILNSSAELIESFVNYAVCIFPEDKYKTVTTVLPKDDIAKKYFFILLLEMIAAVNIEMIPSKSEGNNLLDLLQKISITPKLNRDISASENLLSATDNFISWLNFEFEYEIYSANIGKEIRINMTRKDAIYLIGNRCKHSLTRSNGILKKLIGIYKNNDVLLNPGTELLVLEDIDTWFYEDFGGYHFTKLCELSSEVHHGILEYIEPIRIRSLRNFESGRYVYEIPPELTDEESKFEYYALLNRARSPSMRNIKTSRNLVGRY